MMEFDSPTWRIKRNEKLAEWIGDPAAISFLLTIADAAEFFDDVVDADKPLEQGHAQRVLFALVVDLPFNPFFERYKIQLVPIMHTGINAWLDANDLEKGSDNDKAFAYVLRDWYCELITYVIFLTKGREYMRAVSLEVRMFFTHHESLEAYKEKLL